MDVQTNQPARKDAQIDLSRPESNLQPPHPGHSLWSKPFARTIVVGFTLIFLVSLFYQPAPANPNGNYFSICGFKNLTGLPCPGCGLTHSFCEIGKGHFQSAMDWNWLGLPLFIFFIFVWLKAILILIGRFDWAAWFDRVAARIQPLRWLAIAFAVYGVGRIIYILLHKSSV